MSQTILITGAAGFIGSHFCDFLLAKNHSIVGIDNFSTGQREFLSQANSHKAFRLVELDLFRNPAELINLFLEVRPQTVLHFAANADIRLGLEFPRRDLEQNTIVTLNVLEACRKAGTEKIAFTSTGSVYGEPDEFPTPENCRFPVQTSLYAASKLAGEALISAYAEGYGLKGYVFRIVSIAGPRYSHGHVFDFIKKILNNPNSIEIYGNGKQRKAYLHIEDCVRGFWHAIETQHDKINIFNLGPDETINVDESLSLICDILGVKPKRRYAGGERGWIGDSPLIHLDATKLKKTGWEIRYTIRQAITQTARYLLENQWLLQNRK